MGGDEQAGADHPEDDVDPDSATSGGGTMSAAPGGGVRCGGAVPRDAGQGRLLAAVAFVRVGEGRDRLPTQSNLMLDIPG